MADELQALLDKINDEGVRKAELQQEAILKQANQDAAKILADAKEQAAKIIADARNEAALLIQKGEEAVRQAARDILLSVKQDLQQRVQSTVSALLRETLDNDRLAAVIADVITAYLRQNGDTDDITVLVNPAELAVIESAVKARLADDLKAHCSLAPAPGLANGFKLVFSNSDVLYDISDQALAEAVSATVGPRIAAALN